MKPNIILVLLDGSRWDRIHFSEKFVNLMKEGTLLNNISAAYPYTFGAMNSIFTGLFGKENGVDSYYKMFRLKDSVNFLPEILQKNGYFTTCDLISDKVISSRGFDIYQSHDEYKDNLLEKHPNFLKKSLDESNGKPLFTFLQFSRIHTVTVSEILKKYEWNDQEYYDNKVQNFQTYDDVFEESVKYAEIICNTIKKIGIDKNTIIILFSDHGTGVGERFGERNYGVFTFEETIRTFYLFIGNKILKNKISTKLLPSIQLFPTILELCGIENIFVPKVDSFAKAITKNLDNLKEEPFTYTETGGLQGPFPSPNKPNVFCIKNNEFKLIYFKSTVEWKLFNLKSDPDELKNIIENNLDIKNILKEKLLNWINR
tara:strand:- start:1327 stop:2442 length:1116 start_codon:yes stop_codon:yes gene_type:complete